MNRKQVESLHIGQTIYHTYNKNADGSPQRWRVNGKLKTWKTQPDRFQLPLKYGLKSGDYLTQDNMMDFRIMEEF